MLYIRLIVPMTLLYDNIVKISLRKLLKEISSSCCAVSRKYYEVRESPLHEHRDVDIHLNARMSFSRLKYMSQDEFLCNSANCAKVRDAGCYFIAGIEMKVPNHLICWSG